MCRHHAASDLRLPRTQPPAQSVSKAKLEEKAELTTMEVEVNGEWAISFGGVYVYVDLASWLGYIDSNRFCGKHLRAWKT